MGRITIKEFRSPFKYTEPRVIELEPGRWMFEASLEEIRNSRLPVIVPFAIVLNGVPIKKEDLPLIWLSPGDQVIAVPSMGDDDALPMIIGLVVAIVATVISGGALGGVLGTAYFGEGGLGAIALAATVSIAGGIIVSSMTKPPDVPTQDLTGFDTSQSYSWSPATTQQQGTAIPRPYGINKLYGNVVAWYIDNINDTQYLNILICLGVGPVSRLYNFKINDQPVENFAGVEIHARLGYLDQTPIPNFNDTKKEYAISPIKVRIGSPVTYTTVGDDFSGLDIVVSFPSGLWYSNDLGGLDAIGVNLRVEIKKQGNPTWVTLTHQVVTTEELYFDGKWSLGRWIAGDVTYWEEVEAGNTDPAAHYEGEVGGYVPGLDYVPYIWRWISEAHTRLVSTTVDYVTITGAQSTAIRRNFPVNGLAPGKYDIRVTNLTADRTSSRYGDDCYLTSIKEVYADDFEYPRMVLVGIKALATGQISGSIRFSCYCDGALVQTTLDGSAWQTGFSRKPAWVGYDILTRPVLDNGGVPVRYDGLMPDRVDTDMHLELAEYDASLVPDGAGGLEELCLFDGVFDHASTVWDSLLKVYRIGRAAPYYSGTRITLAINKPEASPETGPLVGMGSILKDSFQEHWSSVEQRPTELTIEILNQDNDFAREPLQVINPDLVTNQAPLSMDMFGVIRLSQAWRDGIMRLKANELLTNTVSVSLPISAIECRIGGVTNLSHDVPQWGYSGRIAGVSGTDTLILDRDVTMEAGKIYGIIIWLKSDERIYRQVQSVAGPVVILSSPFEEGHVPEKYDNYSYGEYGKITKPFRILSIQPDMDHRFKLTCLEYNASLWNLDYQEPMIPTPDYSAHDVLPKVENLSLRDQLTKRSDGTIDEMIEISFTRPASNMYDHAEIYYNRDNSGWQFAKSTWGSSYLLPCFALSEYRIAIVTVNAAGGKMSIASAPQATIRPLGKIVPPSNVTSFWASPAQGGVRLDWSSIPDVDIDYYLLRYNPDTSGTWPNSMDVARIYATSITLPAARSGLYLLKAIDTSGNESAQAIAIIASIPTILAWNALEELIEEPAFAGAKTHMTVLDGKLILESQGEIDSVTDLDAVATFDTLDADFYADGYYETPEVDLGSVQTARCSSIVEYTAVDSERLIDDIQDFDGVSDVDGDLSGVGVETQIAFSQDGTTWGDWQNFMVGDYTFRKTKMRLHAYTNRPKQYTEVSKVRLLVDMPDRSERSQDVLVPVTGLDVTFATPYMARPRVEVDIQSGLEGDYRELTITTTGFNVVVKNSGVAVERTMDWESKGY